MADTKNFGLKGVGNDIQLGKAGPRLNLSGSVIQARNAANGAFVIVRGLDPVGDSDLATKLYVDTTALGLDFKESCRCATTATTGTYNSTGGAAANGQLTAVAVSIDGITLAQGDRVLIKDHGTSAANGIYEVQATTTTLNRATDSDSNAEVTAGNFTFIEEGAVNRNAGYVLQGPDPLTVGTGGGSNMVWVLFSASSDILAGDALTKTGNTLNLDFVGGGGLTNSVATAAGDFIAFSDTDNADAMQLRTWTNVLADLDIVNLAFGSGGILTQTAADTYAARTLTASAVADEVGIVITNGDGVSANPTIGVEITGTTALTDAVATGDSVLLYNAANNGQAIGNYKATVDQLKTFMNAGTSSTSITEGDTTVAVADPATTGTVTTTIDGAVQITSIAASTTFDQNVIVSTGNTLTVADLTQFDVLVAGASGLVSDSGGNLTFNAGVLTVTGSAQVDNVNINGNTISSTAGIDLLLTPLAGQQLILDTAIIVDNGSMTGITTLGFDTVSLTNIDISTEFTDNDVSIMTSAAVNDRIESFGYSTTTGTVTSSGSPLVNQVAVFTTATDIDSTATFTWDATTLVVNELSFAGDTISNNTLNQPLNLQANGTGSIVLQTSDGDPILELNDTVSAVNGLAITAGATGNSAIITTGTGSEANIDIGFLTNGTGALTVDDGAGTYETRVTDPDDIPNKKYVDDAVAAGVGLTGNVDTITENISLAVPGTFTIGAATGIPANCTILSTIVDITTITDTAVTVTVGDASNGAASYMAATENDPQVAGIYIADNRLLNGGTARQANAIVGGVDGTVGNATIIITFRHV